MRLTSLLHARSARVAVLGAALLTTGALLAPVPAQATTAPMSIRVMGGDRQVTAAWGTVAGATGYTVHWGAGTSTAKVLHTTATTIRISGVANRTSYSVRVTADRVGAASKRVTATPSEYAPTSLTSVKAVPAGPNQIKVSWTGGGRARSIAVYVGADSQTKTYHYATAWHPAALSSWTVTLPANLRGVLGAGTGNPVFVRVVQTNSTASTPRMEWNFDGTTKFRLSAVGPWTLAGASKPGGGTSPVTVASWNTQSISATAAFSKANQWTARLPKVAANVENLKPDVVGFQELGTSRTDPACRNSPSHMTIGLYDCTEQYQTLQSKLASAATPYSNVRPDANAYVYQQNAIGNTSNYVDSSIFYRPDRVTLIDSGFISPRAIMGSQWPDSYTDEAGVWAEFQTKDSAARRFLVSSIHMPAAGANVSTVRRNEGAKLATWLDSLAASLGSDAGAGPLPIVATGDFNGNEVTDPDAAGLRMLADGYTDAAATLDRNDIRWATDNLTNGPDGVDDGYPKTAVPHSHIASRIDYLMLKGGITTTRYRNEVRYTTQSNGTRVFDAPYQGSDHNMQLAWLGIPDAPQS
jgi:endonuclease/exonuclease/phosphatase family metal-dependent hydrolase